MSCDLKFNGFTEIDLRSSTADLALFLLLSSSLHRGGGHHSVVVDLLAALDKLFSKRVVGGVFGVQDIRVQTPGLVYTTEGRRCHL